MIRFCDATLKRKLWLEAACEAFLDYQPPGAKVNRYVQADLADYMGRGISPADAAELYQAKRAVGYGTFSDRSNEVIMEWRKSLRD